MRKNNFFSNFKFFKSCVTKFHFGRMGGGAAMLLLSLAFSLFSFSADGQDLCEALLCGNLTVEIVRQDVNVTSSCPSSAAPCSDKFRQIAYKVYLRSKKVFPNPNTPYLPFNLDYKMLDVAVKLKNNGTPQYSYIDVVSTQTCFENGAGASWFNYSNPDGDKVIFTLFLIIPIVQISLSISSPAARETSSPSTPSSATPPTATTHCSPAPPSSMQAAMRQHSAS